jgi:D-alanyl-D-alanine carboxypeptidase/D-alanyl-D-alanine-endopeptidase (penicillin-binding protein 4)
LRLTWPTAALVAGLLSPVALLQGARPAPPPSSLQAFTPSRLQASPPSLQTSLDSLLADPVLARALVGVRIEVLADAARGISPSVLYARDSQKLVMPASNMKLVTLAVAADRLGWSFQYDTRLEARGRTDHGTLEGDLVVVGGGDPSITGQDFGPAPLFAEWADALVHAGIRRVNGRIVGDDRLFDRQGLAPGWSWDYLAASFAAPSGALSYNENAIVVRVVPGRAAGTAATIDAAPVGHGLAIRNEVTTGPADSAAHVELSRPPGSLTLTVVGSVPLGGPAVVRGAAVDDPTRFFVDGLRLALVDHGIAVRDGIGTYDELPEAPAPPDPPGPPGPPGPSKNDRRVIATRSSAPLSALAGYFLKVSQNFYADMLLRTIGRAAGQPGSVAAGVRVVRQTIATWGIAPDEIVMNDGSGLSRYDYLTADAVVAVLRHVWQDARLRGPFVSALPVAGRDGTLDTRMRGTILDDRVEAKTGTLANVRSLSGYLETTTGKHVVFAILANNFIAPAGQVDAIVERMLALVAAD